MKKATTCCNNNISHLSDTDDKQTKHDQTHDKNSVPHAIQDINITDESMNKHKPIKEHKHSHPSQSTINTHKDTQLKHASCCEHLDHKSVKVAPELTDNESSFKAVYRIVNMDCPTEEMLIRKKLDGLAGINKLEFNLLQRILTVHHNLPSTESIEMALASIDMKPEPLIITTVTTQFFIADMDCPAEESLIRAKLAPISGINQLEFNLMQRTLKIQHAPLALSDISAALVSLNLGARQLISNTDNDQTIADTVIPWRKLALAGVIALLSELTELVYKWHATPFGWDLNSWSINGISIMNGLSLLLAIIAILISGFTTYKKGWIAIRNLNLNINALMSVAVTGAVIIGQYPEAAMVMVLFNLSEAIEAKSLDRARNAIKNLLSLTPERATRLDENGKWQDVDIREINIGSRIRVKPGERIALDGIIKQGHSSINQAPITGESLPVEKNVGDSVYAGTINESGSFEFEVTAEATHSTLARIIQAVEEAQGSRAPIQRFVDKFAQIYTPLIFLCAFLIAIIPPLFMDGSWLSWIYMALVILVIGCPCALVISTPVSIVSGMAAATRQGILIKGGMFLEQGRLLKWLALDKTGTITYGKPHQTDMIMLDNTRDANQIITIAASIAARSDHPVSKAIADDAIARGIPLYELTNFTAIPGQGVSGMLNGKKWYLGNHRMLKELNKCSTSIEEKIFSLEKQGKTVVCLTNENEVEGIFAVADTLKESSINAISELKRLGVKTIMLTGDNEYTARTIAEQVNVDDFKSNMLPEDKLATIAQLADQGIVGMVGDGINDAPALAKADIGFAMASAGSDTAIETADVALMDDDLRKIPRFIQLSRATYAILIQNIAVALSVKIIFFILTLSGFATMWMAVFADVGTSLLVIANGLRATRK